MCNSQCIEAANFAKLFLDEGEIDFVASPNLLEGKRAPELWELCGREVRVETDADRCREDVSPRCQRYRDWFDLVMVIKRERNALIDAIPFMRRLHEVFSEHLRSSSEKSLSVSLCVRHKLAM
jgi:hypothetical protein